MIHIWRLWKCFNFQNLPPPLSIYVQNYSTLLTLDVKTSKELQTNSPLPHSPQIITDQLKENIINRWLLYVIRSFLQVGFRFQYQLINLVWLSFDFFSFSSSSTIWFFVALYSFVCNCSKISRIVFYLQLFTFLVLILQSTCFICTTWKRKQTKSKQEQNHVMSHSNWPRVLLFDLAHKKCSDIINGWLHCLTSGSKGGFLVNVWPRCLVMTQIQFSLLKKNLDVHNTREPPPSSPHFPSPPPRPIASYFCLLPHPHPPP